MKKVINCKIYNTETAIEIAHYETSELGQSDFRYERTTLYKTKKGNFFLAGEGHGMTRWAHNNGNTSGWGNGIEAISANEALVWLERYGIMLTDEKLAEHFADLIEEA